MTYTWETLRPLVELALPPRRAGDPPEDGKAALVLIANAVAADVIQKQNTCVVCTSLLLPDETLPHCDDCHLSDLDDE